MKNEEEINNLEEDLQELLIKAEKILDYNPDDVNHVVEDLLTLNTEESDALAADIMDIEEDMLITEEYYLDDEQEDPFSSLYDEDSDLSF